MNRFVREMQRYRLKCVLLLPVVLAAAFLLGQGGVTKALADTDAQPRQAIRDPKVDPKLSAKQRARHQLDAAIKRKKDAQKYIQSTVEQSATSANTGGGK